MNVVVKKSTASGKVFAPPSKSMAHRLLVCAALSEGESEISGISLCDDVLATANCLRALGAEIEIKERFAKVRGISPQNISPRDVLNCNESGSTLRFLIPVASLGGKIVEFSGTEKLLSRPLSVYEKLFYENGGRITSSATRLTVVGKICGGDIEVPGDISSQFITGLLFSLPTLDVDSRIKITTKVESRPYIELTRAAMADFGVYVIWEDEQTLFVKGGQRYVPRKICVEGDFSGTANLDAFNLIGGDVEVLGLPQNSLQGDKVYREHFSNLKDGFCEINIEDCPDLGPILFTAAAALHGGKFIGTRRLRIKESDRAYAMASELSKFGAQIELYENEAIIKKSSLHTPSEILCAHNDHRIVMALTVLSSVYGGEISGAEAVNKSYPEFFEDIKSLGIDFLKV